jgi:hypothetical protein
MFNSYNYNTNQKLNQYLSHCDLLNKYNLKTLHDVPTLDKIVCEIQLKDFLNASDVGHLDQNNSLSQINSYFLIYILLGCLPYLNCNKNKSALLKAVKKTDTNYSLKISFSTLHDKNIFLTSLFNENWSKLKVDNFSLFLEKNTLLNKKISSNFVFNTIIPGNSFFEVEDFWGRSDSISPINLKNMKFNINFLIKNANAKNKKNVLKNLQFFWISG